MCERSQTATSSVRGLACTRTAHRTGTAVQDRQGPSLHLPAHRPPNGNGGAGQTCSWVGESGLRTHRPPTGKAARGRQGPSSWPPVVPEGRPQRAHGNRASLQGGDQLGRRPWLPAHRPSNGNGGAGHPRTLPLPPHALPTERDGDAGQAAGSAGGPWLPAHRPLSGNGSAGQAKPLPLGPAAQWMRAAIVFAQSLEGS